MGALLALVALSLAPLRTPAVAPASAPKERFSAARAGRHLEVIASAPRPPGTLSHARAREHIVAAVEALGVRVEVQSATSVSARFGGFVDAARVHNVVARLPGHGEGAGAVLLVAHYDTVPTSPGAGDDGHGVAVLLETLRALREGPPLANDVLFLFSDAEESGLLGARAFVARSALRRDNAVAINLEARGGAGPAILFETTVGNGRLLREVAGAAPHLLASSMAHDVARRLGHATDLLELGGAGIAGLSLALLAGATRYHTPLDTVERFDPNSMQQMGDLALALARWFGDADLAALRAPDVVHGNIGPRLVLYDARLALAVSGAAILALALAVARGLRRRAVTPGALAVGGGWMALSLASALALGTAVGRAVLAFHPIARAFPGGFPHDAGEHAAAAVFLSLAPGAALLVPALRRAPPHAVALGALSTWALLLLVVTRLFPAASYALAWPLLGGSVALGLLPAPPDGRGGAPGAHRVSGKHAARAVVLAAPTLLVLLPLAVLFALALPLGGAGGAAAVAALALGGLVPALALLPPRAPWVALVAAALVCEGATLLRPGFTAHRPRPSSLALAVDADAQRAVWVTLGERPDPWTASLLGEPAPAPPFLPGAPRLHGFTAPWTPLKAPGLDVLEDLRRDGSRVVRARVASRRGAPWLAARLRPPARVVRARLDGVSLPGAGPATGWGFQMRAPPPDGIELELELEPADAEALELELVDRTFELPSALLPTPPPAERMASPSWLGGSTFVGTVVRLASSGR